MASSGITMADIARAFDAQNKVVDAGGIDVGPNRLRIESTGNFYSLDDIRNLTIVSRTGEHFRLADITRIEESYQTPASNLMRINGEPAVGIAISTVPTGNVVDMAAAVKESLGRLSESIPEGYELVTIYNQGYESAVANRGFILNLIISVLTVVAILLFFIGLKNGLLIGNGLVFSIFATLIVMSCTGIALQRMSLAAIIIAMGMLVDNAIVVSDSTLVNMQRGMRKRVAIMRACSSTALPLLAATVIAILTFLPIYFSPHITGELLSSLVIVIGVSLMFSWVFALTQTPFFIQEYVRRPRPEELRSTLFDGKYYHLFRRSLHWVISHRYATIGSMVLLLALSAWSFRFIPKVFVPALDKQYFTVDVWLPEGTNIDETDRLAETMAEYIRTYEETEMVSTFIGRTPPRYYLSNVAFGPQPNYTQLLVKCHTSEESRRLNATLQDSIRLKFPEPLIKVNRFELSPLTEAVIEARFLGPDPAVLDSLVGQAIEIMRRNPKVADARNEWGNMALMIRPVYDPVKAGGLGITKAQMMQSVKSVSDGIPVGIYRDHEKKVSVLLKSEGYDITDATSLGNFSVWNGERSAPLSQVTERIETTWEFPQIRTYNRQLSMAAMRGVQPGHTMAEVHGEIRREIEAMPLPPGYTFFWDSQHKDQSEAMQALAKYFPLAFLMLVIILVALFGNFRQPAIILCILPLSLIGVAVGMLLTGFQFGFFPIAGWLGLLGMIVKNVIVLIDEINIQRREGVAAYTAVIESTVSRTRPVLMAATITILGMVPLLFDIAFGMELIKAAKADLKPKLSGDANFQYTGNPIELTVKLPQSDPLTFEGRDMKYGASLSLMQPLYTGGRIRESIRLAKHQHSMSVHQAEFLHSSVCYQTDMQYWNTVARRELVRIATDYRNSIASLVQTIRERVEVGLVDPQDLLMAEVKLNEAEYQVLQAQSNFETGRMALNSLIGVEFQSETEVQDSIPVVRLSDALSAYNGSNRPELLMAHDQLKIAESQGKLTASRYKPQFYVGADGSYSSPGYDFKADLDPNYAIYAKLSVPIFEWGKRRNEKRSSAWKVGAANDRLQQALRLQQKAAVLQAENDTARYTALQNQLNPHFLFNSLNTLIAEIEYNPANAVHFTKHLSCVYRYVLQSQDKTLVSLGEELEFIRSYLFLHEVRLGNCLTCRNEVSATNTEKMLPPLTLQLLVENVIKHNSITPGKPMLLTIRTEDGYLSVSNPVHPKKSITSSGIGLANLAKRYELMCGKEIIIQHTNEQFTVKVPLLYE